MPGTTLLRHVPDPVRSVVRPSGRGAGPAGHRVGSVDPVAIAVRLAPALHWPGAATLAERSWRRVAWTSEFDAWLIAWPSGGEIELHDHGPSLGAISVLAGILTESVPWEEEAGRIGLRHTELPAGTTHRLRSGHVHAVTNRSSGYALSVHVYSPALSSMSFFDLDGDRLVERGSSWAPSDETTRSGASGHTAALMGLDVPR